MKNIKSTIFNKGFTLVEILVVITIIALLTGIIMTNLTSSRSTARDAQRVSDMAQIQLALALYFDRCNQYPQPATTIITEPDDSMLDLDADNGCEGKGITLRNFISKIPEPPSTVHGLNYYWYKTSNQGSPATSKPTDYLIFTVLENKNGDLAKKSAPNPSWWSGNYCSNPCPDASLAKNTCYCVGPK